MVAAAPVCPLAAAWGRSRTSVVLEPCTGAALEALFADLIARGVASEADFDRATDVLASGEKSQEALIA
eukprot:3310782-Prymnesium_polylepis.1